MDSHGRIKTKFWARCNEGSLGPEFSVVKLASTVDIYLLDLIDQHEIQKYQTDCSWDSSIEISKVCKVGRILARGVAAKTLAHNLAGNLSLESKTSLIKPRETIHWKDCR